VRKRAEAEAAIADSPKIPRTAARGRSTSCRRHRVLDDDGRYILWNKKYAEIYNRSSDLFKPARRLQDTIRIGVRARRLSRSDRPRRGWIAERLAKLYQPANAMSKSLRRPLILIEERLTGRRHHWPARRHHELKQREASFGCCSTAILFR